MAKPLRTVLSSVVAFLSRFWPMGTTEDQVLRERAAVQSAPPDTDGNAAGDR